mmetsp:Transcript_7400/g.12490  ORF Transcript_7400/g.12490 Transcript_7400/m.12490 type:complete len:137 (+) Transcript_7400:96-506(+)
MQRTKLAQVCASLVTSAGLVANAAQQLPSQTDVPVPSFRGHSASLHIAFEVVHTQHCTPKRANSLVSTHNLICISPVDSVCSRYRSVEDEITSLCLSVGTPPRKKVDSCSRRVPLGRHAGQQISCIPGDVGTIEHP